MNDIGKFTRRTPPRRPDWPVVNAAAERDLFFQKKDAVTPLIDYLAGTTALPKPLVAEFLATPDIAALAVLCRALGLSRGALETLALISAPTMGGVSLAPATILFDALSRQRAERIVAQWRRAAPAADAPTRFSLLAPRHDA
jgi:hypothetical protein